MIDTARGGTVEFTGANTYTGGTLVEAGSCCSRPAAPPGLAASRSRAARTSSPVLAAARAT